MDGEAQYGEECSDKERVDLHPNKKVAEYGYEAGSDYKIMDQGSDRQEAEFPRT